VPTNPVANGAYPTTAISGIISGISKFWLHPCDDSRDLVIGIMNSYCSPLGVKAGKGL
jgi:hypothetical protein